MLVCLSDVCSYVWSGGGLIKGKLLNLWGDDDEE